MSEEQIVSNSPMLDALNEAEAKPAESTEVLDKAETPAEDKPKTKFAWGDEDRRAKREPSDDDEFDLGYEDEKDGVKVPRKIKLSQMKETAKWLRENGQFLNAAGELRKQLSENPDFNKAYQTLISKAFEGGKFNPEATAKIVASLEGKAEVIAEKVEQNADDIAEAEKDLNELDPDSPQYKIAKRSLNALKAVRSELAAKGKENSELKAKLEGLDKFKGDFETTQKTQKEESDAKQAADLFDSTFGALTSEKTGIKFDDADDAKEFESSVRDSVATLAQQGKINNDAEFTKAIQDSAKIAYERINKRNQRIVTEYLKKKGQLPKDLEKPKEKVVEKSADDESIGEAILREMNAA